MWGAAVWGAARVRVRHYASCVARSPTPGPLTVGGVPVAEVRPLRQLVLRPGRPLDESVYGGDDHPQAFHAAARLGPAGEIVAVGSLLVEAPPWPVAGELGGRCRRIRGMATRPDVRGGGLGSAVLAELLRHAAEDGAALVWCNSRVRAVPFYVRAGFDLVGDRFELPHIGPHQAMQRVVAAA